MPAYGFAFLSAVSRDTDLSATRKIVHSFLKKGELRAYVLKANTGRSFLRFASSFSRFEILRGARGSDLLRPVLVTAVSSNSEMFDERDIKRVRFKPGYQAQ